MRPIEIGEVMRAAGIGRVIASRSKGLVKGDLVGVIPCSFSHLTILRLPVRVSSAVVFVFQSF
jgi:NADPH-dependent curcumin reductase CurA